VVGSDGRSRESAPFVAQPLVAPAIA
jgi:hypothetical protein